jgi:hypothetical protein
MERVGDDSNDLVIRVTARSEVEMLAQRVFTREILLRQQAVDDDSLWAARTISSGKKTPIQ